MKRGVFATRNQIISGSIYKAEEKSLASKFVGAIYQNTLGWFWGSTPAAEATEETEDDLIVSVEYLKRKAESLLHWAA